MTRKQLKELKKQKYFVLLNIKTMKKNYKKVNQKLGKGLWHRSYIKDKDYNDKLKLELLKAWKIGTDILKKMKLYKELKDETENLSKKYYITLGYSGALDVLKTYNNEIKRANDIISDVNEKIEKYVSGKVSPEIIKTQTRKKYRAVKNAYKTKSNNTFFSAAGKLSLPVMLGLGGALYFVMKGKKRK